MKKNIQSMFPKKATEEILFNALRILYSFERLEVTEFGLTFQQIFLLKLLRRNSPLQISEITSEMKLQAFGTTRLIDQLVKLGYVIRETGDIDKRSRIISITGEGKAIIKKIEDHAYKLVTSALSDISVEEISALIHTMEKFTRISGIK